MHGHDVDEYGNHLAASPENKKWTSEKLSKQAQQIIDYNNANANRKEPVKEAPKQQPQIRPINEVRKFNELLNNQNTSNENQTPQPKGNQVRRLDKMIKGEYF